MTEPTNETPNEPTEPIEPTETPEIAATPEAEETAPFQPISGDLHDRNPMGMTAAPSKRGLGRLVAIGVLAVVLLAGIGAAGYFVSKLGGSPEELTTEVPASSTVFVSMYLDPSAAQKINVRKILERFPSLPGKGDPQELIADSLNQALTPQGMNYDTDIQPWLGNQVAFLMIGDPSGAGLDAAGPTVVLTSTNDGAAQDFMAKMATASDSTATPTTTEYKGVTITTDSSDQGGPTSYAVTGGLAIIAEHPEDVEAVIDSAQGNTPNLADDAGFKEAMTDLPKDRLVVSYVDLKSVFARMLTDIAASAGEPSPMPGMSATDTTASMNEARQSLKSLEGFGATLSAESDGISLQMHIPTDSAMLSEAQKAVANLKPHTNAGVSWTPKGAYGIITLNSLDQQLTSVLSATAGSSGMSSTDMLSSLGLQPLVDAMSGDFSLEVAPPPSSTGMPAIPGGTILLATDDEAAMKSALDAAIPSAMAGVADSSPDPAKSPTATTNDTTYRDVTITSSVATASTTPFAPAWAATDGMGIVGSSVDAVKQVIDTHLDATPITQSGTFQAAIKHGSLNNSAMVYVDVGAIWRLASAAAPLGNSSDPASQVMSQIQAVLMTQTSTEKGTHAEFFLLLTDASDSKTG